MSDPVREFLKLGKHLLDMKPIVAEDDKNAIVDHLAFLRARALTGGGSLSGPTLQSSLDVFIVQLAVFTAPFDPVNWRVCEIIASQYIKAGLPVPDVMKEWAADYIVGRISKPKIPATFKNKLRNDAIAQAVEIAVEAHSLKPTRNDASESESACDVVAHCLKEHGVPLGYHGVKQVYGEWKKRNPYG